jgi:hypothetical protein
VDLAGPRDLVSSRIEPAAANVRLPLGLDHTPISQPAPGLPCRSLRSKGISRVNIIRFTIIDDRGILSFVGPCHGIKMFVAACSSHPRTSEQLLQSARRYDEAFIRSVESGLAIFDEHNTRENYAAFLALVESTPPADLPPFRVVDERSRAMSLKPAATGVILFNLNARRIIQVQNSYAEVLRADRGRIRQNGRPTRMLYYYSLPEEWSIVP